MLLALACSDYDLGKSGDHADTFETVTDGEGRPADEIEEDSATLPRDTSGPVDDTAPPPDTGSPCTDGYWGDYYNLDAGHADVEGEITGVVTGDLPSNHDWWDAPFFAFRRVDPSLEFGNNWWPVDEGLSGDPQYFAVHWTATLEVDNTGAVDFEMGSDDDGWAFIDGWLVADLGGVHGVESTAFSREMVAGNHSLDLYMAERHTSDSGFWFRWTTPGVRFYACP